ncbi:MAG: 4Fe-4S binding protein [Methanomassiliicoccus sp.]|nr:4Fe-4S binding protein [Methanomassiliicoccus sp.]
MFKILRLGVLKRGVQTRDYPRERGRAFDAFLGLPVVDVEACDRCSRCVSACPVQAITVLPEGIEVSAERCIFCAACAEACKAITMGPEFELAARSREDLRVVYRHG